MTPRAYCRKALGAVSRSFIRPIEMLRAPLDDAVAAGYLLCRIADTIEDAAQLPLDTRLRLFDLFEDVLTAKAPAAALAEAWRGELRGEPDAEDDLVLHTQTVLDSTAALPHGWFEAMVDRVVEMARGMAIYARRRGGPDGFRVVLSPGDLSRYCWFVAGIVGQMLTDLFALDGALRDTPALRARAESFGLGLQLVNILKDVTDDHERGVVYIPASCLDEAGLAPARLLDADVRPAAHRAVRPVFAMARDALEDAVAYVTAVRAARPDVRLFCAVPLWMAARTLAVARDNDAQFTPGAPVKIARAEVYDIIARCEAHCRDDAALVADWRRTAPWWTDRIEWEALS